MKKTTDEKQKEETQMNESINRERGAVIDSKIVAIMKTHKKMAHAELV